MSTGTRNAMPARIGRNNSIEIGCDRPPIDRRCHDHDCRSAKASLAASTTLGGMARTHAETR